MKPFNIWHNNASSQVIKDTVSKLTIKFWMLQKGGKMKDYNKKLLISSAE
jgi:hypothetical protein